MKIKKKTLNYILLNAAIILIFAWDFISSMANNMQLVAVAILMVLSVLINGVRLTKSTFIIVLLIGLHGLVNVALGNNGYFYFANEMVALIVCMVLSETIIKEVSLSKVVKIYYKGALVVAALAIVQEAMYLANIRLPYFLNLSGSIPTYGAFMRASSIFVEPSGLVYITLPAVYLSLENLLNNNRFKWVQKWHILFFSVALIFSFSSLALIGLAVVFAIILKGKKGVIQKSVIAIVAVIVVIYIYKNFVGAQERFNDLFLGMTTDTIDSTLNTSSRALLMNIKIAIFNFQRTMGFGGGIGSHPMASIAKYGIIVLNGNDACSLALRIISEFGVIGAVAASIFIIRFKVSNRSSEYYIFSKLAFLEIVMFLFRQGNYFYDNFFIFIFIYYYSYKRYREDTAKRNSELPDLFEITDGRKNCKKELYSSICKN